MTLPKTPNAPNIWDTFECDEMTILNTGMTFKMLAGELLHHDVMIAVLESQDGYWSFQAYGVCLFYGWTHFDIVSDVMLASLANNVCIGMSEIGQKHTGLTLSRERRPTSQEEIYEELSDFVNTVARVHRALHKTIKEELKRSYN